MQGEGSAGRPLSSVTAVPTKFGKELVLFVTIWYI